VGGGRFVVYAHLQKGSITVNAGQVVRQGQVVGRIGNSGNSLAPHLHLHVSDGPDPFAAQGVPFVLARVTLLGQLTSVPDMLRGYSWSPAASRPARELKREMPLENMIVRF